MAITTIGLDKILDGLKFDSQGMVGAIVLDADSGIPLMFAFMNRDALAKTDSPEVRKRAEEVLNRLAARGVRVPAHGLAGDALRLLRATEVLEKVGGTEATKLLRRIEALGGPAGDEAKAALRRAR